MHFLIFFTPLLFVETSVSGQDENLFTEYATTNENSINTVDSLGLGPIALGTTGNYLEQVANIDFSPSSHPDANLWDMSDETPSLFESNSEEGDGYSIDLLAGACASTDKLEARDKNELCTPRKANGLQIPTLPTLEELENKLVPLVGNEAQNPCPPQKKYHLCCDCDGWNNFMLCVDCTPHGLGPCYAPHIEVCCETYGFNEATGWTNLDDWTDGEETIEQFRAEFPDSEMAERCIAKNLL